MGLALLVGLFLGPVLSLLPQATLAALVFVAVFGLIDVKALRELWRVSRRDFAIAAVTAGVGLTAGLLEAVAVGVVFTLLLVLSILDRPRVALTESTTTWPSSRCWGRSTPRTSSGPSNASWMSWTTSPASG